MSRPELAALVEALGEPRYRADQIFKGVHQRRMRSLDEITDLPKAFRAKLAEIAGESEDVRMLLDFVDSGERPLLR